MKWKPCVLVVAPTATVATTLFAWLTDAGCAPLVVSSFSAAKQYLEENPCLLISEVRLGEYNGLHLALRAQAHGVPAVILGEPDVVLQREATQLGAIYLSRGIDAQQLLSVIRPLTELAARPGRRWDTNVSFISLEDGARFQRAANPFRS